MFSRLKALIIKEFIAVWQDKRSRMSLIGPPLIQFFIFTFAATLDVQNVSLGVLNKDYGYLSYDFCQQLKGSPRFHEFIHFDTEAELKEAIDTQRVLAAVEFNENFSKQIYSGYPGNIYVIADGRKSNASQIVQGYIIDIAEAYTNQLNRKSGLRPTPSNLVPRNWYNANLIYIWFTLSGLIGVISMLTSVSVSGLSISREKEMGTFEQLLVSPLNSWQILIGKAIPALIIGVGEGTGMLLAGVLFLKLPLRGNILLLYLSMIVFIFAIVGIGLFISSISKTQQQSTLGIFLCLSPMIIMSGFATPIANMPIGLQYLSALNPLRYFLVIVRGICLKDIPAWTVFNNTWPMLLIAFVTLSIAAWFFRKQLG